MISLMVKFNSNIIKIDTKFIYCNKSLYLNIANVQCL